MTKLICLMPTYNKEDTLAQAIESVMMQKTDFDYKLIILDDCSTDNSYNIAKDYQQKYPRKIEIIRNETNLKLLRTIINGYKQLKWADYFCVLDADDWYTYDKKFAEAVNFLDSHKDFSMYMTNIILKRDDNETPWYAGKLKTLDFNFKDRKKDKSIFVQTSGVVYRNIYFKTGESKEFDEIFNYKYPESYRADGFRFEWYLQKGKVHFENKITVAYNYNANGLWSGLTEAEQNLHNAKLMYSCAEFIKEQEKYYLDCAKNQYYNALNGFRNDISGKKLKDNSELISELAVLLINHKNTSLIKRLNNFCKTQLNKLIKLLSKLLSKDIEYTNKNYPIRLTENEQSFLLQHVKNITNYLEFGSGGSTFILLMKTLIPNIVSVESDKHWIEYMRKWDIIKDNENLKRLIFKEINIGKTREWGIPVEENKKYLFPKYSSEPFLNDNKYDFVFIDGRFRVACTLQTILNCNNDTKILMHDFNDRAEYHCLLQYIEIIDTMDTMALFKIKNNIDKNELLTMYEKYKFISD